MKLVQTGTEHTISCTLCSSKRIFLKTFCRCHKRYWQTEWLNQLSSSTTVHHIYPSACSFLPTAGSHHAVTSLHVWYSLGYCFLWLPLGWLLLLLFIIIAANTEVLPSMLSWLSMAALGYNPGDTHEVSLLLKGLMHHSSTAEWENTIWHSTSLPSPNSANFLFFIFHFCWGESVITILQVTKKGGRGMSYFYFDNIYCAVICSKTIGEM